MKRQGQAHTTGDSIQFYILRPRDRDRDRDRDSDRDRHTQLEIVYSSTY